MTTTKCVTGRRRLARITDAGPRLKDEDSDEDQKGSGPFGCGLQEKRPSSALFLTICLGSNIWSQPPPWMAEALHGPSGSKPHATRTVFSPRQLASLIRPGIPTDPHPPRTLLRYVNAHIFFSLNCTFLLI